MFHHFTHHRRRWAEPPEGGYGPEWFFGRGFGRDWGGFGPPRPPRGERVFGRGDLKYVILDLLKDQPRHGYDIMRALEGRSRGWYRASPGSVYPTLQMLEDLGYVTAEQREGKKVYAITDAGREFLTSQSDAVEDIRSRVTAGWSQATQPEVGELMEELRALAGTLFRHGTHGALGDPDKLRRLREIVARTRSEVDALFDTQTTVL